jgi:hypothetical protein
MLRRVWRIRLGRVAPYIALGFHVGAADRGHDRVPIHPPNRNVGFKGTSAHGGRVPSALAPHRLHLNQLENQQQTPRFPGA